MEKEKEIELTGATDGKFYRYRVESANGLAASTELKLLDYINSGWTLERMDGESMVFKRECSKEELLERRENLLKAIGRAYRYAG